MNTKPISKAQLAEIAYDAALFDAAEHSEDCPRTLSLPSGEYTIPLEFEDGQESYVIWGDSYEEGASQRREYQEEEKILRREYHLTEHQQ